MIQEAQQNALAAVAVETVAVPVAARDLERGTLLSAQDLVSREFPAELVPAVAITDPALLEGQVVAERITQGDIFRESSLYGRSGAPLSSAIEPGKTVIAFPIMDLFSGTGLFAEGDRVDLLLSVQLETTAASGAVDMSKITGYTVQNVRVMRILTAPPSGDNPNPTLTALLLELDPSDAVMVKKVKDAGGTVDMALRSPVDAEPFNVSPVTDRDLIRLMSGEGGPSTVGRQP